MSKLADSHEGIVERLLEVFGLGVLVVEAESVLRDDIARKGIPDSVDGQHLAGPHVVGDSRADSVELGPHKRLELANRPFGEPARQKVSSAARGKRSYKSRPHGRSTHMGLRALRRRRCMAWSEVVKMEPSFWKRPFIQSYLSDFGFLEYKTSQKSLSAMCSSYGVMRTMGPGQQLRTRRWLGRQERAHRISCASPGCER